MKVIIKRIRKRKIRKRRSKKGKNKPAYSIKFSLKNNLLVLVKDRQKVPMKLKYLALLRLKVSHF
jgi:hypothetical protein